MDEALWLALPAVVVRALRKLAWLADAPAPLEIVTGEHGFEAFAHALSADDVVDIEANEVWSNAVTLKPAARALLEATPIDDELLVELVEDTADFWFAAVPESDARFAAYAARFEPHIERIVDAARRLERWEALARLQHQRALLVTWGGVDLARGSALASEAVDALRRTDAPHPATLALLLTSLARFLAGTGRRGEAIAALEEAERHVVAAFGDEAWPTSLVRAQLAAVAHGADDAPCWAVAHLRRYG